MRLTPACYMAWVALATAASAEETIRIVEDGRPRAVVAVAVDADDQTRQAAELLVQFVRESSGAELPISRSPLAPGSEETAGPTVIHVGPDAYVRKLGLGLDQLDDDGFAIRVGDGQIAIAGPTPYGTEFGVCEFLERYLGVRWLMPGPHGTDVPKGSTIDVPLGELRQEPAFFSRLFSGLTGSAQVVWARRNRMHGRVQFHHNLHRLFPVETYAKTHPEFFPIRGGQRFFPATNDTHGWQPCFSADGIVEEAVKNICRYFDEHPGETSYSLGVIDSGGHCECEKCRAQDSGQENFVGRRDVSDRYYAWCNRVVEGVLQRHPDKVFGCLAYSEVAQPPQRVKVHPRIVPYMTYDRMKWIDPRLRAEGEAMTERWQQMSPTLGWYDYIYGAAYCVPRVWFHQMADYYRFGRAHGVKALYAEAYPTWGEGPKLYVSLKLQWDPQQDVDALLREWYVRAVGPAAAGDLAAYYAHWEDFWTRRILDSAWFTTAGQYLAFHTPSYLADVSEEDIVTSRTLLERVVANAQTAEQKHRAGVLIKAFEYYEASAMAYAGKRLARQAVAESEADALALLEQSRRTLEMGDRRKRLLMEEFQTIPALMHGIDFDRRPQLQGDDWGTALIWRAFDQAEKSPAVRARLRDLAAAPDEILNLPAKTMLALLDENHEPITQNPSFEQPDGQWPAEWSRWIKWGVGTKRVAPEAAHTGKLGMICRGLKRGGPHQTVDYTEGCYAATAFVRVPKPVAAAATVTLQITPIDDAGQNLPAPGLSTTVSAHPAGWQRLAVAGRVPATIDNKPVKRLRLMILVDGFAEDEELYADDAAMYRIE